MCGIRQKKKKDLVLFMCRVKRDIKKKRRTPVQMSTSRNLVTLILFRVVKHFAAFITFRCPVEIYIFHQS